MALKNTAQPQPLGKAPKTYDSDFYENVLRTIERQFIQIMAVTPIYVSSINVSRMPTSATGLPTGQLWCDTSNSNVVKKV